MPNPLCWCSVISGDTTKIVTSMHLDSQHVLVDQVSIHNHGTVGAWSVLLPGVTVERQATLAPLSVPALGSTVKQQFVYMGSPANPVKVRAGGCEPRTERSGQMTMARLLGLLYDMQLQWLPGRYACLCLHQNLLQLSAKLHA